MSTDSKGARIESAELERLLKECTPGEWRWEDRYNHPEYRVLGLDANCENIRDGRIHLVAGNNSIVLEEWAEYAGDAGLSVSDADRRILAIAPTLAQEVLALRQAASEVRRSALLEARKLALVEKVSGETGTEGDEGYNAACDHIADAILALAERKE